MTWIFGLVGLAILLTWLFLSPAGPAIERSQPLTRVGESVSRVAMSQGGSQLLVTHEGSGRFFTISKPAGAPGLQQTVELRVSSADWPGAPIELLEERLLHSTVAPKSEDGARNLDRVLHFRLTGHPQHDLESAGRVLADQLAVLVAEGDDDRFTLRMDGVIDQGLWRRVNAAPLRQAATTSSSWLMRKFAAREVRKCESEQSGPRPAPPSTTNEST